MILYVISPSVSPSFRTLAAGQLAPGTTSAQVCFPSTANQMARASVWIGLALPTSPHLAALRVSVRFRVREMSLAHYVIPLSHMPSWDVLSDHAGVDVCIRDFNGQCLRIRETPRAKVGHIAIGISDQVRRRCAQRSLKLLCLSACVCWHVSALVSGRSQRVCSVCRVRTVLWCPTISRYRKQASSCAVSLLLTPPTSHSTDKAPAATCHGAGESGMGGWRPGTDVFINFSADDLTFIFSLHGSNILPSSQLSLDPPTLPVFLHFFIHLMYFFPSVQLGQCVLILKWFYVPLPILQKCICFTFLTWNVLMFKCLFYWCHSTFTNKCLYILGIANHRDASHFYQLKPLHIISFLIRQTGLIIYYII